MGEASQDPICGIEYEVLEDIEPDQSIIHVEQGYSFAALPLAQITKDKEFIPIKMLDYDLNWNDRVLGVVPGFIDVDSSDPEHRKLSELYLNKVFKLAIFTGVTALMVNVTNSNNTNLARLCSYHLYTSHGKSIWFRIKVGAEHPEAWQRWSTLLMMLPALQGLCGVVLELGETLPSPEEMARWRGEIVSAVSIPTSRFVANAKGCPVLRREVQSLVISLFKYKTQVIIYGRDLHGQGMQSYQQYITHLHGRQARPSVYEEFSAGYEDRLQIPLQPLKDNLDNATYEIFEKDPFKYKQYEEAVYRALLDRGSPPPGQDPTPQVIMVVGAGRGPLVRASMNATKRSNIPTTIYAVEKNEAALTVLRNLLSEERFKGVTIVEHDMRTWEPPEKADIIVSELLGSFSDNELSPECLDGAQRLMKPDGISIPSEYTSYLAPLSSRRLHNAVSVMDKENTRDNVFHMGYVVRIHNANIFDKPQTCFTFTHPNPGPIDNSRHVQLTFTTATDLVMHGFAGYFDARLYGDLYMSIHPDTHSPDMFSWFPMFFPLKTPVCLRAGDTVKLDFWRVVETTKIWYEWVVSEPTPTPIHNSRGETFWIGLYS